MQRKEAKISVEELNLSAERAFKRKRYAEAAALFSHVIKHSDDDKALQVRALVNRGISYSNCHDTLNAINDFSDAIKLEPNCSVAYFNRGLQRMKTYKKGEAVDDFNKTIELTPNETAAYVNLYSMFYRSGDHVSAEQYAANLVKAQPNSAIGYHLLGNLYLDAFSRVESTSYIRNHGAYSSLRYLGKSMLAYSIAAELGDSNSAYKLGLILDSNQKCALFHAIKTLKPSDAIKMLMLAKDPDHRIGRRFWQREGALGCSLTSGTLGDICKELDRLTKPTKVKALPSERGIFGQRVEVKRTTADLNPVTADHIYKL